MIEFHSQNDFVLVHDVEIRNWISETITHEGYELGNIDYVFCNDEYLLNINQQFLEHDTYTDIISFDYTMGKLVGGEIYISTERVSENANYFGVDFNEELHRVIIHGILHFCGYKDKTKEESLIMRGLEEKYLEKLSII